MNLRPYQNEALRGSPRFPGIFPAWQQYRRVLTVLPTGTGKTIIFAAAARDIVAAGGRVLILAHREELIRQAADKIMRSTGLACAVEKADESSVGCLEQITVGSVQSLLNPDRRDRIERPTHIIVDEAHHVLSPSYRAVLDHWPEAYLLGVTATPDRGDMRDLGAVFEVLAYEYTLMQAVADGYLSRIRAHTIPLKLDMTGVTCNGDYQAAGIGRALEPYLPQIAREVAALGQGRKTLIFAPLCDTAQRIRAAVEASGLPCFYCSGEDRSQILAWEAHGPGCAMVNAMLLTEGYDHPPIDAVCVLRPTKVRSLYAQMVGRGTRPLPGKDHLLLIDFLWMSERHQLCRPAHLIAEDEAVAEKMVEAAEREAGAEVDVDADALADAKREVVAEREAALAKKLAEMKNRKRQLVDPLQFAMSIGDGSLAAYQPALASESAPPTPRQIEALAAAGIYAGDVQSAGMAEAILGRLRERAGMASPKQIRQLEKRGWSHVGQMSAGEAGRVMSRLSANLWQMSDGLRNERDTWNAGAEGKAGER